jgi:hypothetical protein
MSDDSGIIVLNVPEVAGALKRYPQIARPEFEAASDATLLGTIPEVAAYPTEPSGSSYRRTGTLGRTWTAARPEFSAMGTGFEGTIGNATPYAVYVEGPTDEKPGQAAVHRGRWPSVTQVMKSNQARAEALFRAAADRIAAAINKVTA